MNFNFKITYLYFKNKKNSPFRSLFYKVKPHANRKGSFPAVLLSGVLILRHISWIIFHITKAEVQSVKYLKNPLFHHHHQKSSKMTSSHIKNLSCIHIIWIKNMNNWHLEFKLLNLHIGFQMKSDSESQPKYNMLIFRLSNCFFMMFSFKVMKLNSDH